MVKIVTISLGGTLSGAAGRKITNQNRCPFIHVAHNFWVIFLLKHLSLGELRACKPFFGQKVLRSASNALCHLHLIPAYAHIGLSLGS